MALISKLRPFLRPIKMQKQSIRKSGHGLHLLKVEPTMWVDYVFWDYLHFYTLVAAIPIFMFGGAMSIFIGDSVLKETPIGYEPEDWECERNPVQRLLSRYIIRGKIFNIYL